MYKALFNYWGIMIASSTFLFSWVLFWNYTSDPIGSYFAAAIASGLVFLAFIVIRMLVLAFRR